MGGRGGTVARIARALRSAALDLRFGAWIGGAPKAKPPSHVAAGAYSFTNSGYALLEHLFRGRIEPDDVLVDVGCGRGRVLNHWLSRGHRGRIVGIELDTAYARATARRLARWTNVSVIAGDAAEHLPADATLVYLFNPFDAATMRRFRDALAARCMNPRLTVIYYAPTCLEPWTADPSWQVEVRAVDLPDAATHAPRHHQVAIIRRAGVSAP